MMNADLLPAAALKREAVVYGRQSTQTQVRTNHSEGGAQLAIIIFSALERLPRTKEFVHAAAYRSAI